MKRVGFFLCVYFFSMSLGANTWVQNLGSEKKLFIKGFYGDVVFHFHNKKQVLIKAQYKNTKNEESESLQVKGNWKSEQESLQFQFSPHGTKEEWIQKNKKPLKEVVFHVYTPVWPIELYWKKGAITFKEGTQPFSVHLQDGKIHVSQMTAALSVHIQGGALDVRNVVGDIDVHSYNARLNFKGSKGKLSVQNFLGVTRLSSHEGRIFLDSQQGVSEIEKSQGELEFENGRKLLKISSFEGKIRGKTEQGKIHARLKGEIHFRLQSETGDVDIATQNSGALVNLGTKEGQFHVASYLKHTRYPTIKLVRGRLRGENKGYVYIRTSSGKIRLR